MRYRSNKIGASYTVPSWLPEALGGALAALAAQRGMAVGALVQEILHWGLAKERLQEESFSYFASAFADLKAADRRGLPKRALRFGPDVSIAAQLCAIVQ